MLTIFVIYYILTFNVNMAKYFNGLKEESNACRYHQQCFNQIKTYFGRK